MARENLGLCPAAFFFRKKCPGRDLDLEHVVGSGVPGKMSRITFLQEKMSSKGTVMARLWVSCRQESYICKQDPSGWNGQYLQKNPGRGMQ